MKTTLIEQDLIIIRTINDLILKNRDEADKTITRFKNGEIDYDSYTYIMDEISNQITKYNETINHIIKYVENNQIKGVK